MKGGFELHVPGVAMSLKDDVVASIVDLRLGHLQVATIETPRALEQLICPAP